MLKLRAYNEFEGSGVLESKDGKLTYIDFPYTNDHEYPCTEAELQRLVIRMNFKPCELEFQDGPSAIGFLRAQGNESGNPFAGETEEAILERFNSIGIKNLEGIVDAIQEIYEETKNYSQAILGLERINNLRIVKSSLELRVKVLDLLDRCRKDKDESLGPIKQRAIKSEAAPVAINELVYPALGERFNAAHPDPVKGLHSLLVA